MVKITALLIGVLVFILTPTPPLIYAQQGGLDWVLSPVIDWSERYPVTAQLVKYVAIGVIVAGVLHSIQLPQFKRIGEKLDGIQEHQAQQLN